MTQIRLGDLLLRAGVLNEMQLEAALAEQQRWGGKLGAILVRMGALSEDLLVKALSKQLGIPRANLQDIRVPEALLERVDRVFCEQNYVVPLQYVQERRALVVGIADPFNVVLVDDLSRRVGLRVEPMLAGEQQIQDAIARVFGAGVDPSVSGSEPGMKLMNNQGTTLVKSRAQIIAEHRARATTGVERPTPAASPSGTSLAELERLAEKQSRAVRAILELLIEKGHLTREEYFAWLNQRPG